MPIPLGDLQRAALRSKPQRMAKSLNEALLRAQATAFLCHSHSDQPLAEGLEVLLAENGWDLYIDWKDTAMPPKPNKETAEIIKRKIVDRDWFLFLATPNSTASRWCPWEIGYADSVKPHDKILLIRTREGEAWYGNEYLQLYREITYSTSGGLAAFPAGSDSNGISLKHIR